jgi:hypothetical protein
LCPEVEELDLHPAAALRLELAAWGALDDARRDAAADAAHRPGLHPAQADDVEKLVALAPDDRERHASRRQSELQVAPAAELQPDARELCTLAAGRFAERSCAVPAVAEQLALPQPEPLA